MSEEMFEGDMLDVCRGYAHAILELNGWDYEEEEWAEVNPESFTTNSVKMIRRDCLMFLERVFQTTKLSDEDLQAYINPYDLGWDFYVARMSGSEFDTYDMDGHEYALDRIARNEFGAVNVELSDNGRIHVAQVLPTICQENRVLGAALIRLSRRPGVPVAGIVNDTDFSRSMQRGHYTRHG